MKLSIVSTLLLVYLCLHVSGENSEETFSSMSDRSYDDNACLSCKDRCGDANDDYPCNCNNVCENHGDCCEDYEQQCKSCAGRCDADHDYSLPCQCNAECSQHDNCCDDYDQDCLSCKDRCGQVNDKFPCNCNKDCKNFGDCCKDYLLECGEPASITDDEILEVSKEMLSLSGHSGSLIELKFQGQTTSESNTDEAPFPLVDDVHPDAFDTTVIKTYRKLFNNYEPDENKPEDITPQEEEEAEDFLKSIIATEAMKTLHKFLANKGYVSFDEEDFKDYIDKLWFTLYERSGKLSSSGFEHVFVGETDNGGIGGFHNWIHFYDLEQLGSVDYKGWVEKDIIDDLAIVTMRMSWGNADKPYTTFVFGLNPEYELGVYTLCWIARPNSHCKVLLGGGTPWVIQTYVMEYNGGKYVATSYFT